MKAERKVAVAAASGAPESSVERSRTRLLLVLFAAVLGISMTRIPARLGSAGTFVAELAMVLLGALLTLRLAPPRLGPQERRVWRVVVISIALITLGQIVRSKKLYPLMPYTMYGRAAQGDVRIYEFQALHRSGARDRFGPSTVVATLGRARIVKGLSRQLETIAALESKGRAATRERALLQDTMAALVTLHNQNHPGDPVVAVDVVQVVLPPPYDAQSARRRKLMTLHAEASL